VQNLETSKKSQIGKGMQNREELNGKDQEVVHLGKPNRNSYKSQQKNWENKGGKMIVRSTQKKWSVLPHFGGRGGRDTA